MSNPVDRLLNSCTNYVLSRLAQPCALCGARSLDGLVCAACAGDLPRLPVDRCPSCAAPTPGGAVCGACLKRPPAFDRTVAVYFYEFPLSVLIRQLKYDGVTALAPWLGERLAEQGGAAEAPEIAIPMPLHVHRLRERGFNQAALLGRTLAAKLGVPLVPDACRRGKATRPQVELPIEARRRNMRDAFVCDADLTGRRVALVDDVMTSGASLDELARVVKRAGAAEVTAWVVARTSAR